MQVMPHDVESITKADVNNALTVINNYCRRFDIDSRMYRDKIHRIQATERTPLAHRKELEEEKQRYAQHEEMQPSFQQIKTKLSELRDALDEVNYMA